MSTFINSFFDFKELLSHTKKNTLKEFPTVEEYLSWIEDMEYDSDRANELYSFITSEEPADLEVCEENNLLLNKEGNFVFSLFEDTSEYNEGGSYPGGYEFEFEVDVESELLIGLEVINHN